MQPNSGSNKVPSNGASKGMVAGGSVVESVSLARAKAEAAGDEVPRPALDSAHDPPLQAIPEGEPSESDGRPVELKCAVHGVITSVVEPGRDGRPRCPSCGRVLGQTKTVGGTGLIPV